MNKKYKVAITEILRKYVTVEAKSAVDAEYKAMDRYWDGNYILDLDDFYNVEFDATPIEGMKWKTEF